MAAFGIGNGLTTDEEWVRYRDAETEEEANEAASVLMNNMESSQFGKWHGTQRGTRKRGDETAGEQGLSIVAQHVVPFIFSVMTDMNSSNYPSQYETNKQNQDKIMI